MSHPDDRPARRIPRWRAALLGLVALVLVAALTVLLSPWPSALMVRWVFERGGAQTAEAMSTHVPTGIAGFADEKFGDSEAETLDVWFPQGTVGAQPTVLWVHGGGWVAGDKSDVAPYLKILAGHGFTVIGSNYALAPGTKYPAPVRQTNAALKYVLDNAERFNVDPKAIVLAGDSAGAQIVGQLANAATNPAYAKELGIVPATTEIAGMILNCGPYEPAELGSAASGILGFFVRKVEASYFGSQDREKVLRQASVLGNLSAQFPPTWISGGNGDSLTAQGMALAGRLEELGVPTVKLFFPVDRKPALGHEYQFQLDTEAAQQALQSTVEFLRSR